MSIRKAFYGLAVLTALLCGVFAGYHAGKRHQETVYTEREEASIEEFASFSGLVYEIERTVTSSIPIYNDFRTAQTERTLRMFLYPYHKEVALRYGVPVGDDDSIQLLLADGKLVEVPPTESYYYYGVPGQYRFLTPEAKSALGLVAERFQMKLAAYGITGVVVKFAVSSALRPNDYQEALMIKNRNAVGESTHSYGVSFDIFFDDFYVSIPGDRWPLTAAYIGAIRPRIGFVLGDALRRQFRTVLAETVLELQSEGLLYVIHEYHQKVYHITFTPRYAASLRNGD
ncbi:MAG: DUF5715 family protein [Spirochaetota bacterium]